LDVAVLNPFGPVLLGQHPTVQQCDGSHMLQTVIRLFFGPNERLVALLAAADNVIGDVES
jgi:hypothetical protein